MSLEVKTWILAAFVASSLSLSGGAQAQVQGCVDVYQNAVSNTQVKINTETQKAFLFNLHCEEKGTKKSGSSSGAFDFIDDIVDLGFSFGSDKAEERHEEFCKIGAERSYSDSKNVSYDRFASVAALTNFNQCVAQVASGLTLTHEVTNNTITVFGTFGAGQKPFIDSFEFNEALLECRSSSFSSRNQSEEVTPTSGRLEPDGPFTISCERLPTPVPDLGFMYPRVELILTTSLAGTYTIRAEADAHLGFTTASQAAANYSAMNKAKLDAEAAQQASELKYASMEIVKIYRGDQPFLHTDSYHVACPTNPPQISATGVPGHDVGQDDHVLACRSLGKEAVGKLKRLSRAEGGPVLGGKYVGPLCGHEIWVGLCAKP